MKQSIFAFLLIAIVVIVVCVQDSPNLRRQLARPSGGGGGGGSKEKTVCAGGEVTKACGASGKNSQCDTCPSDTHECVSGNVCALVTDAPTPTPPSVQSCQAWCMHPNNLGDYHGSDPDAWTASDYYNFSPDTCSSSTGCPCTISSYYATTWTIVTTNSDRICDAHNFHLECPTGGCDGTHCANMVISISGRVQNNGEECICMASATGSSIIGTIDVFSSECKDLDDETRFNTIWEA